MNVLCTCSLSRYEKQLRAIYIGATAALILLNYVKIQDSSISI